MTGFLFGDKSFETTVMPSLGEIPSSYLDRFPPNILTSSSDVCASKALNSVDHLSVKTDNWISEIYPGFSLNILIKLKVYICQKKMNQATFLA